MSTIEQTLLGKHFKLRLTLAIELVDVRLAAKGTRVPYRGNGHCKSNESATERLGHIGAVRGLLDKLVAVQMDLEPVCGAGTEREQVVASLHAIADACDVLR